MKRIERLHALENKLRRRFPATYTAEELASYFEVSPRTIKRDLASLERSGLPLWSRPGPYGGYGLSSNQSFSSIALSSEEAVALVAGIRATSQAPYSDLALSGIEKVLDVLDDATRQRAIELSQRIWIDSIESGSRRVRSVVEQALADQKVVQIWYRDAQGHETVRDVEPMIFACRQGRWYLIGWCRMRDGVRWFTVSRITEAYLRSQPYLPRDVDLIGAPPKTARPLPVEFSP